MPELGPVYGLVESEESNYSKRTEQNVAIASAIIAIARDFESPGTKITERYAFCMQVPLFKIPYPALPALENSYLMQDVRTWLWAIKPDILMFAGNRESKAKGIQHWTDCFTRELFKP